MTGTPAPESQHVAQLQASIPQGNHTTAWGAEFQEELAINSWTMFALGMVIIGLRMYVRLSRVGVRGLQRDDYMMIFATTWFITLVIALNLVAASGGRNLIRPGELQFFTKENIQVRIRGLKIVVVSEQAMLNLIYSLKVCMLFLYARLVGPAQQKQVFYVSIYVSMGWIATQIAFFTACRPFNGYWAIPPPDLQCATLRKYSIVQASFNISSDILILLIPLQMVISLHLAWKKKLALYSVFGLGISARITAAVLTKVFNLTDIWSPTYMLWYIREAAVAVYVANLPIVWPRIREMVPMLRSDSIRDVSLPYYHQHPSRYSVGEHNRWPNSKNSPTASRRCGPSSGQGEEGRGSANRPVALTVRDEVLQERPVPPESLRESTSTDRTIHTTAHVDAASHNSDDMTRNS